MRASGRLGEEGAGGAGGQAVGAVTCRALNRARSFSCLCYSRERSQGRQLDTGVSRSEMRGSLADHTPGSLLSVPFGSPKCPSVNTESRDHPRRKWPCPVTHPDVENIWVQVLPHLIHTHLGKHYTFTWTALGEHE